jgi:hypothetical protein
MSNWSLRRVCVYGAVAFALMCPLLTIIRFEAGVAAGLCGLMLLIAVGFGYLTDF